MNYEIDYEGTEANDLVTARESIKVVKATTKSEVEWYKEEVYKNITLMYPKDMHPKQRPPKEVCGKTMKLISCKKHGVYIVYLGKKRIGGFAVFGLKHKYNILFGFFLLEKYRNQGYGTDMMDWIQTNIGLNNLMFGSKVHNFVHYYLNYACFELPGIFLYSFPLKDSVETIYLFKINEGDQFESLDMPKFIEALKSAERPFNALKYNKFK